VNLLLSKETSVSLGLVSKMFLCSKNVVFVMKPGRCYWRFFQRLWQVVICEVMKLEFASSDNLGRARP
jgi:hypothetical protein